MLFSRWFYQLTFPSASGTPSVPCLHQQLFFVSMVMGIHTRDDTYCNFDLYLLMISVEELLYMLAIYSLPVKNPYLDH